MFLGARSPGAPETMGSKPQGSNLEKGVGVVPRGVELEAVGPCHRLPSAVAGGQRGGSGSRALKGSPEQRASNNC